MNLGIVGHEAAKFTKETEHKARVAIQNAIFKYFPEMVYSGGCHLGGVDAWAIEEAEGQKVPWMVFLPKNRRWEPEGYKARNLQIAQASDLVLCVVVKDYHPGYKGMRFKGCYHCKDRNPPHVKSGGCWTAWKAHKQEWVIIG